MPYDIPCPFCRKDRQAHDPTFARQFAKVPCKACQNDDEMIDRWLGNVKGHLTLSAER